jgi:DNA-binding winged helix-turn-helix (wHTH) protein
VGLRFGPFSLDATQRRLWRADTAVHLTPKAFDLLVLLAEAWPRVVPKAELHERLWKDTFVTDATLVGVIKELRRALDVRSQASVIRTAHRVGYALALAIEPRSKPRNDVMVRRRKWLAAAPPGPHADGLRAPVFSARSVTYSEGRAARGTATASSFLHRR